MVHLVGCLLSSCFPFDPCRLVLQQIASSSKRPSSVRFGRELHIKKKKFESDPTVAEKVSFPCRGSRVRLRVEIDLFSVRFGLFSVVSGESVSLVCRGRESHFFLPHRPEFYPIPSPLQNSARTRFRATLPRHRISVFSARAQF